MENDILDLPDDDPNGFFDIALPVNLGHRTSKSSTDSKEFDFSRCTSPLVPQEPSDICPADELFYKGKLLPLYMSEQMRKDRGFSSIAFSYYLRQADVDLEVLTRASTKESSGSSSRNSGSCCSSSECSMGFTGRFSNSAGLGASSRYDDGVGEYPHPRRNSKWKLLLGQRRSAKVTDNKSTNSPLCSSCGKSYTEFNSFRSLPTAHSAEYHVSRHSTDEQGSRFQRFNPRLPSQSVYKAKEFWRKYLKPFISRTHLQVSEVSSDRPRFTSDRPNRPVSDTLLDRSFFRRSNNSKPVTPVASPAHSGILCSLDDVQGAIAYCKQSRAT